MTDTPNRPPLWEVMYEAFWQCPRENWRLSSAYMIRALRDWLVPEEKAPTLMRGPDLERLCARQHLRALLTTEAEIAERGDVQ